MPCYITQTGSFLPGLPVENDDIDRFLGTLDGESDVKRQVLAMNGIVSRHYAQDASQTPTHDVYQLATIAIENCLDKCDIAPAISFLSAGTTYAPLAGPGLASLIHYRLQVAGRIDCAMEISSHAGICTSAAAALVAASRAVRTGEHSAAICVGAEHASEVLKSKVIQPVDDRAAQSDLRRSQWFMSVFLRFMLSDGAGAFLLQSKPPVGKLCFQVDWTHSMSFAHEAPLCMKLQNSNRLLSQDVSILSRYLVPTGRAFVQAALAKNHESLDSYRMVLPHLSSYFFRRKVERILEEFSLNPEKPVPYWTNLATAGNTGSASIYVMLDQFLKEQTISPGERLLLFIPESGQFNFVMVSLTAVLR